MSEKTHDQISTGVFANYMADGEKMLIEACKMKNARIAELEAEVARHRREADELRDILHGIGRQADAASRRPAADLVAAATAKATDR